MVLSKTPKNFSYVKEITAFYGIIELWDLYTNGRLKMKVCTQCNTEYIPRDYRQKFCSRSCAATHNNLNGLIGKKQKGVDYGSCPGCETLFTRKQKYCSHECHSNHKLQRWLAGEKFDSKWGTLPDFARDYLLEQVDYRCPECGWDEINPVTKVSPLEIDHIDGDSSNNDKNNLRVMCPNCHSLTPTFRTLNRPGNGRKRSPKK